MKTPEVHLGEEFLDINQLTELPFENKLFIDCKFSNLVKQGAILDSVNFIRGCFDNVDWYWCMALDATFIDCEFHDCDLRGAFAETVFARCEFHHCKTGDNELGGKTRWDNTQAIDCKIFNTTLPIVSYEPYQ